MVRWKQKGVLVILNNEKMQEYYGIFTGCWKLIRNNANISDNWDEISMQAKDIVAKSSNKVFAQKLVLDTLCELERTKKREE